MRKYRLERKRKEAFQLTEKLEMPLDLYEHLPFQIAVVSNLLQLNRDFAIRDIIDLEPRELRVILNIGSYMPIKAADVAYQTRIDSYTVSRSVKKLKSMGMIESAMHENNKKAKYLKLTQQGEIVYRRLCNTINERTETLESVITSVEKIQLMRLLAKLEDKAESMLADHAQQSLLDGKVLPADQKEIIRWSKKSSES